MNKFEADIMVALHVLLAWHSIRWQSTQSIFEFFDHGQQGANVLNERVNIFNAFDNAFACPRSKFTGLQGLVLFEDGIIRRIKHLQVKQN